MIAMEPICINNFCFDRIHLWIQYDWQIPQFIEVVIEVFYPKNRKANGLVMFNHGFLVGNDLFFYPKKVIGAFTGDNPLFAINPSAYYNYSAAIVEQNWAMAFVSAAHSQTVGIPGIDIGGNPRVGQEAYAAASYLIKYGATDFFYREEETSRNRSFFDSTVAKSAKFMVSNKVIFAGHSVGGAHAQASACGFEKLQELGKKNYRVFDPVMFDREFIPAYSERLSKWDPADRADPVGLLQLSPVDQKIPILSPGMKLYREALSTMSMPMLMIVGECDCACLDDSNPPAWSDDPKKVTQFTQLAPAKSDSWSVLAKVAKGSHCGYLTLKNDLCGMADKPSECKRCPGVDSYKPEGDETALTTELLKRLIDHCSLHGGHAENRDSWLQSECITWLNKESPDGVVKLVPFSDGQFVEYAR
jgi:hypothetical protein